MAFYKQALHVLAAASFVFVNLVCPCVPANAIQLLPAATVASHAEPAAANCHEQPAVDPTQQQQECPECSSVSAISCEEQAPVAAVTLVNLLPDGSQEYYAAFTLAVVMPRPLFTPAFSIAMLPDCLLADLTDSPVRRHDLQIE